MRKRWHSMWVYYSKIYCYILYLERKWYIYDEQNSITCCCSVTQSCPTLQPMDCSMPGFPILHCLLKFAQTHVHWQGHPTIFCHPLPCLQSFPASGSFPVSWLFPSGGQSNGASASASVLPMNIQGWFPLGLIGLISWLSKGLPRVFSSTAVGRH